MATDNKKGQGNDEVSETDNGKLINAERVEYIKTVKDKAVAVFSDGDVSATLTGDLDEAERALAPVVAAAPGYVRLHYQGEDDDGPIIDRTPMVAWRITGNGAAPVSPGEDVPWFNDAFDVRLPDGRIVDASVSAPHDDEKAWLKTVGQG